MIYSEYSLYNRPNNRRIVNFFDISQIYTKMMVGTVHTPSGPTNLRYVAYVCTYPPPALAPMCFYDLPLKYDCRIICTSRFFDGHNVQWWVQTVMMPYTLGHSKIGYTALICTNFFLKHISRRLGSILDTF